MDVDVTNAAVQALFLLLEPHRLMILFAGVCMGLGLGILPGIGGLAGTALLLPFTYNLDPSTAFALLLGFGATTTTADPISAIVLGAPGHAASAATALDGFPMTKRGEGGRALGASYLSAMLGGLFGAALLGVLLPIARPLILDIGSPELFGLAVFGISMVSVLSSNAPLRGLTAACFGMMLSMIGSDPQTGIQRWTLDSLYLWQGLPLVPVALGVFALPELCDLLIARKAVVEKGDMVDGRRGLMQGARDCVTHWFLVLRCSCLGAVVGAIPGISAAVIDWISYAHAMRTEKGASETFGKGDVRGVIAAESATNSREGGALIPTIVFGMPTSAGMAILLGAFLMHGLVPGPDMLTTHLDITYAMVWSIAIANLLGSGLCFLFSGQFARLATVRYTLILPVVLSLIYVGAFEGSRQWGDLYSLFVFGVIGWGFKHLKWPRPPLVLGFILGSVLERYLFISISRFGSEWMLRPAVIVLFVMAALSLCRPLWQEMRQQRGISGLLSNFGAPRFQPQNLFAVALLCLFGAMLLQASDWNATARTVPMIVGIGAMLFCFLALVTEVFKRQEGPSTGIPGATEEVGSGKMHLDVGSSVTDLPVRTIVVRGAVFFGWLLAFLASMALVGLIPTVPLFIICFMRIEGREKWLTTLLMACLMVAFVYVLFDRLLGIPWPSTIIGEIFPALKWIPSV